MKCTKCNTESTMLINTYYDNKMECLCDKCFIDLDPKLNDISIIDERINETKELIKQLEDLLKHAEEPDLSEMDEALAAIAFTPSKSIAFAKQIIADLLQQKEKVLNAMGEKEILTYKLKIAVHDENYEFAFSIRDKLNKYAS